MFYGFPIDNWIGLLEYCIIVLTLFVVTGALSCILANKTLHTKNKRKNNFKHKKVEKKSYFIDVA